MGGYPKGRAHGNSLRCLSCAAGVPGVPMVGQVQWWQSEVARLCRGIPGVQCQGVGPAAAVLGDLGLLGSLHVPAVEWVQWWQCLVARSCWSGSGVPVERQAQQSEAATSCWGVPGVHR